MIQFAKKTGDYSVLSHADLSVLALTYALDMKERAVKEKAQEAVCIYVLCSVMYVLMPSSRKMRHQHLQPLPPMGLSRRNQIHKTPQILKETQMFQKEMTSSHLKLIHCQIPWMELISLKTMERISRMARARSLVMMKVKNHWT